MDGSQNVRHLLRRLNLRDQDQVGRLRNNLFEVLKPERQLIDANHALGCAKIHRSQCIANQQPGRVLFRVVDGIFQIENDCVRRVQSGVDEVLGLVAGKIKARTA